MLTSYRVNWIHWTALSWHQLIWSVMVHSSVEISKWLTRMCKLALHLTIADTYYNIIVWKETLTVLKYSRPEAPKASAISLVVTTQDIGWPLPIGFPMVTMSGTKSSPCSWNAQKCFPTRPKPTWTSSAMKTPPALWTALKIKQSSLSIRRQVQLTWGCSMSPQKDAWRHQDVM